MSKYYALEKTNPNSRELWTKRTLAARLHKTPRWVEYKMAARLLPYLKIGRSVLFDPEHVFRALARFEVKEITTD